MSDNSENTLTPTAKAEASSFDVMICSDNHVVLIIDGEEVVHSEPADVLKLATMLARAAIHVLGEEGKKKAIELAGPLTNTVGSA